jgi:LacI family transcriptional regulator
MSGEPSGATVRRPEVAAPTITDVARRAGVSPTTVSRVLGGSTKVAAETRVRVHAVMDELGYRPSAVARSLRRRTTDVLGLVITDITNPFYPEVVRGAEDEAAAAGRSVLLCNSAEDPVREVRYLDALEDQRIDALIVASTGMWVRHRQRLLDFPRPVVLLHQASDVPTVSSVANDDASGGRMAAEHLLDRGYGRLVYVGGPVDAPHTSDRYRAVVAAVGAEVPHLPSDGHAAEGHAAMQRLATSRRPPFGVVAHNDLTAIGVLSAAADLGWHVPDEIGVVGFDDLEFAQYVQPALTTVRQDKYGMGAESVRVAIDLLTSGVPRQVVVPASLVVRCTTRAAQDLAGGPDRDVPAAT